eukprot:3933745-Rhodomonas_salina.2
MAACVRTRALSGTAAHRGAAARGHGSCTCCVVLETPTDCKTVAACVRVCARKRGREGGREGGNTCLRSCSACLRSLLTMSQ